MSHHTFARIRCWKPRFTIGGLMTIIVLLALVLAALRPLAGLFEAFSPSLARVMNDMSTPETGIVLSCLVIGGFVSMKLMSLDEKMS